MRQKLLEHVAAALIIRPKDEGAVRKRKSTAEMTTPPRSPTKSHSPQRLAAPVQVSSPEPMSRRDVESIRIYADSDISALLKDVEAEITRMGEGSEAHQTRTSTPTPTSAREESQEKAIVDDSTLDAVAFQP